MFLRSHRYLVWTNLLNRNEKNKKSKTLKNHQVKKKKDNIVNIA